MVKINNKRLFAENGIVAKKLRQQYEWRLGSGIISNIIIMKLIKKVMNKA